MYRILDHGNKYELPYAFFMLAPSLPTERQPNACERSINEAFSWCRDQFGPFPGGETGNAWNPDLGHVSGIKDMQWYGQRGLFLFATSVNATAFKVRWG